jgi:glycine cleavage system H protein
MAQPSDRLYARTHEWVLIAGKQATIGVTDYAQEQLGDVVFVELPAAGKRVTSGGELGNIESVKAVSELFSPVDGVVVETNGELESHPELVNTDPFGGGWLVRVEVAPGAGAGLMDAAAYARFIAEEGAH